MRAGMVYTAGSIFRIFEPLAKFFGQFHPELSATPRGWRQHAVVVDVVVVATTTTCICGGSDGGYYYYLYL